MSPLCANRCAYRGAILELLCYSMLAGQQPPRVACVCVQLARSRRVECGRTAAAGCSSVLRCNALRDGGVEALPGWR